MALEEAGECALGQGMGNERTVAPPRALEPRGSCWRTMEYARRGAGCGRWSVVGEYMVEHGCVETCQRIQAKIPGQTTIISLILLSLLERETEQVESARARLSELQKLWP